jgi:drug/metabolite transporter (DMT)-like permease
MIGALLTALFFGIAPVVAGRAIALIGFVRTNVIRLALAVVVLGAWALAFGPGLQGQWPLFVTAGAIGFGIGGLCLLASLSRLGAPLASLIEETIAAAVALTLAIFWVPNASLTTLQLGLIGVILVGIAIGLFPYIRATAFKGMAFKSVALGVGLALVAGIAQGISVAATKRGQVQMTQAAKVAAKAHHPWTANLPDTVTVSFERLIGGIAVAVVVYLVARYVWRRKWGFTAADGSTKSILSSDDGKLTSRPLFWGSLNALFGPIMGVTCLVWALSMMNNPGEVQAIQAVAPLIAVPFAFWLQGHKPPRLWYLGAAVAIAGLAALYLNS